MKLLQVLLCASAVFAAEEPLGLRRLRVPSSGKQPTQRRLPIRTRSGLTPAAGRIIDGSDAQEGQFPWQAALRLDRYGFCGGSLVSDSVLLTAAHCVDRVSTIVVTLGAVKLTGGSNSVTQIAAGATRHPNYWTDNKTADNDIAVVKLGKPVTFTDYIKVVRLPSKSQADITYEGEIGLVSGWGITADGSTSISLILQYVEMMIIANEECSESYPGAIDADVLCTLGNPDGSPCSGDSGGALVFKEADGNWTQLGIVSFGSETGCENGYPEVFTKVVRYLDWISENTGLVLQ